MNISVVKERKNNYYELNIQHTLLNGIPLPSAPLIDDRASFPKSKKNELWIAVLRQKGNATTINELYNIPYSNWILLISAPPIVDRASSSKRKKKNF